MTKKFVKQITLYTAPYYSATFGVECETKEQANKELLDWVSEYPELTKLKDGMLPKEIDTIKSNIRTIEMILSK